MDEKAWASGDKLSPVLFGKTLNGWELNVRKRNCCDVQR